MVRVFHHGAGGGGGNGVCHCGHISFDEENKANFGLIKLGIF